MPIYLYWGDDRFSLKKAVTALQDKTLDPAWRAFNFDRLGADETIVGLNQAMTPPLGQSGRLVWLENTTIMHQCSEELLAELERTLPAIPETTHLLLTSDRKPDGRLKSTKLIKKYARAREFKQIAPWDTDGLVDLAKAAAKDKALDLEAAAANLLAEAVGNDRRKLDMELEKLALYAHRDSQQQDTPSKHNRITAAQVRKLVPASAFNSFQLAGQLRSGNTHKALEILTQLLDNNEPALKLLAVLVGQFRTWLWVKVAIESGERDNQAIAKLAELGNPKRVYFLQKEVRSLTSQQLFQTMELLLDLEYRLKRGQDERRTLQTTCIQITQIFI